MARSHTKKSSTLVDGAMAASEGPATTTTTTTTSDETLAQAPTTTTTTERTESSQATTTTTANQPTQQQQPQSTSTPTQAPSSQSVPNQPNNQPQTSNNAESGLVEALQAPQSKWSKKAKLFLFIVIALIILALASDRNIQNAVSKTIQQNVGIVAVPELDDRLRDLKLTIKHPVVIIPGIVTSQLQVFSNSFPSSQASEQYHGNSEDFGITGEELKQFEFFLKAKIAQSTASRTDYDASAPPPHSNPSTPGNNTPKVGISDESHDGDDKKPDLSELYEMLMTHRGDLFHSDGFEDLIQSFDNIFEHNQEEEKGEKGEKEQKKSRKEADFDTQTTSSSNPDSSFPSFSPTPSKRRQTSFRRRPEPVGLESSCTMPTHKTTLWGGTTMVNYMLSNPSCFIKFLRLNSTTGLDNNYIKLRPVDGANGGDYLFTGYWVWARVLNFFDKMLPNPDMYFMATYDWRESFKALEIRDGFFTRLKQQIERMVMSHGKKAVIVNHSMGGLVTQYFLSFVSWSESERIKGLQKLTNCRPSDPTSCSNNPNLPSPSDWFNTHIESIVNIASPHLGVPKAVSALLSGEMKDVASLGDLGNFFRRATILNSRALTQLLRSFHSVPSMFPKGGEVVWGGNFTQDGVESAVSSLMARDMALYFENNQETRPDEKSTTSTDQKPKHYVFGAPDDLYGYTAEEFDYATYSNQLIEHYGLFIDNDGETLIKHHGQSNASRSSVERLGNGNDGLDENENDSGITRYNYDQNILTDDLSDDLYGDDDSHNGTNDESVSQVKDRGSGKKGKFGPNHNKLELFLGDILTKFNFWVNQSTYSNSTLSGSVNNDAEGAEHVNRLDDDSNETREEESDTHPRQDEDEALMNLFKRRNPRSQMNDYMRSTRDNKNNEDSSDPKKPFRLFKDQLQRKWEETFERLSNDQGSEWNQQGTGVSDENSNPKVVNSTLNNIISFFQQIDTPEQMVTLAPRSTPFANKKRANLQRSTPQQGAPFQHSAAKVVIVQGFSTLLRGVINTVQQVQEFKVRAAKVTQGIFQEIIDPTEGDQDHDNLTELDNTTVQSTQSTQAAPIVPKDNETANMINKIKLSPHDVSDLLRYLSDFLHKIQLQAPIVLPPSYQSGGNMLTMVKKDLFDERFLDKSLRDEIVNQMEEVDDKNNDNVDKEATDADQQSTSSQNQSTEQSAPPTCYYDYITSITICNRYKIDFISTFQRSLISSLIEDVKQNPDQLSVTDFFQTLSSWTPILTLPSDRDISPQQWHRQQHQIERKWKKDLEVYYSLLEQHKSAPQSAPPQPPTKPSLAPQFDLDLIKVLAKEWFYGVVKYLYAHRQTHHVFSTSFSMQNLILNGRQFAQFSHPLPPQHLISSLSSSSVQQKLSTFSQNYEHLLSSRPVNSPSDIMNDPLITDAIGGIPPAHDMESKNGTNPINQDTIQTVDSPDWNRLTDHFPSRTMSGIDKNDQVKSDNTLLNGLRGLLNDFYYGTLGDSQLVTRGLKSSRNGLKHFFNATDDTSFNPWNDIILDHSLYDHSVAFDQHGLPKTRAGYQTDLSNQVNSIGNESPQPSTPFNGVKNETTSNTSSSLSPLLSQPLSLRSINLHNLIPDLIPTLDLIAALYPFISTHLNKIRSYTADTTCIIADNHKYLSPSSFTPQVNPLDNSLSKLQNLLKANGTSPKSQSVIDLDGADEYGETRGCLWDLLHREAPMFAEKAQYEFAFGATKTTPYRYTSIFASNLQAQRDAEIGGHSVGDYGMMPTAQGAVYTFNYPHRTSYISSYWIDIPLSLPHPSLSTHSRQHKENGQFKEQLSMVHFVTDFVKKQRAFNTKNASTKSTEQPSLDLLGSGIKTRFHSLYDRLGTEKDRLEIDFITTPFELHNFYYLTLQIEHFLEYLNANQHLIPFGQTFRGHIRSNNSTTFPEEEDKKNGERTPTDDIIDDIVSQYPGYPMPLPISGLFVAETYTNLLKKQFCLMHQTYKDSTPEGYTIPDHRHCVDHKRKTQQSAKLNLIPIRYISAWGVLYRHIGGISRQYARSTVVDPVLNNHKSKTGDAKTKSRTDGDLFDATNKIWAKIAIQHLDIQLHGNYLLFELYLDHLAFLPTNRNKSQPSTQRHHFTDLLAKLQLMSSIKQQLHSLSSYTLETTSTYRISPTSYRHDSYNLPGYLQGLAAQWPSTTTQSIHLPTTSSSLSNPNLPSFRYNDVDDREWSNVLTTGLPKDTHFNYISFYGVNKYSERSYLYSGISAQYSADIDSTLGVAQSLDPTVGVYMDIVTRLESDLLQSSDETLRNSNSTSAITILNTTEVTRITTGTDINTVFNHHHRSENGIGLCNGDGTVPLISMGWVGDRHYGPLSHRLHSPNNLPHRSGISENGTGDNINNTPPASAFPLRRKIVTRQYDANQRYSPYLNHYSSLPIDVVAKTACNDSAAESFSQDSHQEQLCKDESFQQPLLPVIFDRLSTLTSPTLSFVPQSDHQSSLPSQDSLTSPQSDPITSTHGDDVPLTVSPARPKPIGIALSRSAPLADRLLDFRLLSNDHVDIMGNDNMLVDLLHVIGSYDVPWVPHNEQSSLNPPMHSKKTSSLAVTSSPSQHQSQPGSNAAFQVQYQTYINTTRHLFVLQTKKQGIQSERRFLLDQIDSNLSQYQRLMNGTPAHLAARKGNGVDSQGQKDRNQSSHPILITGEDYDLINTRLQHQLVIVDMKMATLDQILHLYETKLNQLKSGWVDSPYGYFVLCEDINFASDNENITMAPDHTDSTLSSSRSNPTTSPIVDCIDHAGRIILADRYLSPVPQMGQILAKRFNRVQEFQQSQQSAAGVQTSEQI